MSGIPPVRTESCLEDGGLKQSSTAPLLVSSGNIHDGNLTNPLFSGVNTVSVGQWARESAIQLD